jgi:hypothetical protein
MTVRRVFEPAAAALAARVASDEDLRGISAAYAGMESARTAEDILEPDLAFHRRIAEATNNPLLAYIGNMLSLALRESIKLSSLLPNTNALSLPRHKAILTALLARDPFAAQQATLVQLKETREDLTEVLGTARACRRGSDIESGPGPVLRHIINCGDRRRPVMCSHFWANAQRRSVSLGVPLTERRGLDAAVAQDAEHQRDVQQDRDDRAEVLGSGRIDVVAPHRGLPSAAPRDASASGRRSRRRVPPVP